MVGGLANFQRLHRRIGKRISFEILKRVDNYTNVID